MLALMHFVVWWKDRTARANLVFSVMAIAVAAFAVLELALMRAETPEQFGLAVRWMHAPAWVIIVSLVGFVRLYLRASRLISRIESVEQSAAGAAFILG
jgi:two-component system, LuxR family, sensor kinase FixL